MPERTYRYTSRRAGKFVRGWKKRLAMTAFFAILLATPSSAVLAASFQLLHSFLDATDGGTPLGGLTLVGSTLYGTTSAQGPNRFGTVYSLNLDGTHFRMLHAFASDSGGGLPDAGLTLVGSTLYGTTSDYGLNRNGTVFSINPTGTNFQTVHQFTGADGMTPRASLTQSGSTLLGTTYQGGGSGNEGTVFAVQPDGSGFQMLHAFALGSNGSLPQAGVTAIGSTILGTSFQGGASNRGSIFSIDSTGSNFQTAYSFTGATNSGAGPQGNMIVVGTKLIGTTGQAQNGFTGTIFSTALDGTGFQLLHAFNGGSDGGSPEAAVTLVGSTLYGTTVFGGDFGGGTIFSMDIDGTNFQTIYSFHGSADGASPRGELTLVGSTLYGTTSTGGANDAGTVFAITVPEPAAFVLGLVGFAGLGFVTLRKKYRRA
jgi:uncharacterized repeat protein (TIGR03803 family)